MRNSGIGYCWLQQLADRTNMNIAGVAQANKTARIVWAMLIHGPNFRADVGTASGREGSTV
jgi:hypothetical protein